VGILAALLLFISCMYQPTIQERICQYDWDCDTAIAVFTCESNLGQHPDTYSLDEPNGGIAQLNKATWEWWFGYYYGWTWEQIVTNDDLNLAAAYIVWTEHTRVFNESGWEAWSCYG
jgi:hypothetical protein